MTKAMAINEMKATGTHFNTSYGFDGSYKRKTVKFFKRVGRRTARHNLNKTSSFEF